MAIQKTVLGKTGLNVSRVGIGGAYGISGDASMRAFERGLNYLFWMPAWEGLTDGLRRLVSSFPPFPTYFLKQRHHLR